jgi:hypothetical protein
MDIDFKFKNYGNFDVSGILSILNTSNLDWDEFDYRQKTFAVHRKTKTIPLLFHGNFKSFDKVPTKNYELFKNEIDSLEEILNKSIGTEGQIFRAILVMLVKGGGIAKHLDGGPSLKIPKRIHIPIITNDKCFFTIEDEIKNLKVGEVWEINNSEKLHGVSNEGDEDRVHLIVDWKPIQ